jgi:hypothetical protein
MRFSLAILPFLAAIASAYPADINAPAAPAAHSISESADGHDAITHETQLKNIIRNDTSAASLVHTPVSEIPGIPHGAMLSKRGAHTNLIFDAHPNCMQDSESAITAEQGKEFTTIFSDYLGHNFGKECCQNSVDRGYGNHRVFMRDINGTRASAWIVGQKNDCTSCHQAIMALNKGWTECYLQKGNEFKTMVRGQEQGKRKLGFAFCKGQDYYWN